MDPSTSPCVRIVAVRHCAALPTSQRTAQQRGDPPLSRQGCEQAAETAEALARAVAAAGAGSTVQLWSSPMRRALHTAQPVAARLRLQGWGCHGALYEFRADAEAARGCAAIAADPGLCGVQCEGFAADGGWDCGSRQGGVETEDSLRKRACDAQRWLETAVLPKAAGRGGGCGHVVLVSHQTFLDCLLQRLVDGDDSRFRYGDAKYRIQKGGCVMVDVVGIGEYRLTPTVKHSR